MPPRRGWGFYGQRPATKILLLTELKCATKVMTFKAGFLKCNTSANVTIDIQVLKNRSWNSDQPASKICAYTPLCPQAPLDIFSGAHHTKSTERLDACRCPALSSKTIQLKQRDH